MKEDLIEEENPIIEKFEIQTNENTKFFINNECPINLRDNKYIKLKYHFGKKLIIINLNLLKLKNYTMLKLYL